MNFHFVVQYVCFPSVGQYTRNAIVSMSLANYVFRLVVRIELHFWWLWLKAYNFILILIFKYLISNVYFSLQFFSRSTRGKLLYANRKLTKATNCKGRFVWQTNLFSLKMTFNEKRVIHSTLFSPFYWWQFDFTILLFKFANNKHAEFEWKKSMLLLVEISRLNAGTEY